MTKTRVATRSCESVMPNTAIKKPRSRDSDCTPTIVPATMGTVRVAISYKDNFLKS